MIKLGPMSSFACPNTFALNTWTCSPCPLSHVHVIPDDVALVKYLRALEQAYSFPLIPGAGQELDSNVLSPRA